jgi:signal transduction histidine kinase
MEKQGFAKFWIIITSAFLLVVLFLVAWYVSLEITEQDVLDKYNQQQLFLVSGTAGGIEGLFDDLASGLGSLGLLPEVQYFDEDSTRRELARKLEELRPQGITDIGILDADGTGWVFAVDNQAEGVDYSWRSYFKAAQAISSGSDPHPLIIELQTTDPGEPRFRIAIPVFETAVDDNHPFPTGDFAGVILGSLNLNTLIERYIAPFKPPGDGHIFLVNGEYDIIWSTDSEAIQGNLLAANQSVLTSMVDTMEVWTYDTARSGAYAFTNASRGSEVEMIAYAPVKVGGELMAVGVRTPGGVARQTSLSTFQSQQFVFLLSVLTILAGVLVGGFVLSRETRRRFQLEEALRKSEMEQIILAERNRLAGDLHDSVTQGLYGIVLHADAAKGQISAGQTERASAYLDEIKDAGKEGLAEMRLLIFELRPPVLEKEGLAAALEARLYAVERRAGLKAELRSEIDGKLPLEVEDGLYRIAQEALNNALKHSQAGHIRVHLRQEGRVVTMEIADDGRGFELQPGRESGGMGLSSMEERARTMGGKFAIESEPGDGTRIFVEVSG